MSLEQENADGRGGPVPGDPGCPSAAFEAWGWDLTQRDWGLRAREPTRNGARVLASLLARIEAAIARMWRLVRRSAHDTAR
jgi:hypothetical protein